MDNPVENPWGKRVYRIALLCQNCEHVYGSYDVLDQPEVDQVIDGRCIPCNVLYLRHAYPIDAKGKRWQAAEEATPAPTGHPVCFMIVMDTTEGKREFHGITSHPETLNTRFMAMLEIMGDTKLTPDQAEEVLREYLFDHER